MDIFHHKYIILSLHANLPFLWQSWQKRSKVPLPFIPLPRTNWNGPAFWPHTHTDHWSRCWHDSLKVKRGSCLPCKNCFPTFTIYNLTQIHLSIERQKQLKKGLRRKSFLPCKNSSPTPTWCRNDCSSQKFRFHIPFFLHPFPFDTLQMQELFPEQNSRPLHPRPPLFLNPFPQSPLPHSMYY